MPTADRREFVEQAIGMFLEQDYSDRELVIWDNGHSIFDLLPNSNLIRYYQGQQVAVGGMRNKLCRMAAGELIAHWDDDDIYRSDYLSCQVQALLEGDASICGLNHVRCMDLETGEEFEKDMGWFGDSPWLDGPTLLYRRSAWLVRPFKEFGYGEEFMFVNNRSPLKVIASDRFDTFVHRYHAGCSTWKLGKHNQYHPGPA